ncbi:MAG: hypothetical protein WBY44_12040 [Bryobacteraceae bacterium]
MAAEEKRPNWVERKASRDANLREHAEEVWHDVRSAIQDCCESFRIHYNRGVQDQLENGSRIRITVSYPTGQRQTILVAFRSTLIEVTVGERSPKTYNMDADEAHAFITDENGKEINPDDFTRVALEAALTKPPSQSRPSKPSRPF